MIMRDIGKILKEEDITNGLYRHVIEEAIGLLVIEQNDMSDSLVRFKGYTKRIKNIDKVIQLLNTVLIDL